MTHEERARAVLHEAEYEVMRRDNAKTSLRGLVTEVLRRILPKMVTSFSEIEKDAIEKSARAICERCNDPSLELAQDFDTGEWIHVRQGCPDILPCAAAAIHAMKAGKTA